MPIPDPDHRPRRIGVREFRGNFTAFMREVGQGASFLVTSHDEVVAEVRPPPSAERAPRVPGALRGKITMAEDFDVLPEDLLDAMEGAPG